MNERLAHLMTCLYPHSWRDRYGDEFEVLLMAESGSFSTIMNVVRSALKEQIVRVSAPDRVQQLASFGLIVKVPSAVVPIGMSFLALGTVLTQIAVAGAARQSDEGAAAHIWQLLVAGQMPVLLFFALKWLPKAPRQALRVIAVQAAALMTSIVPVFLLRW